MLKKFVNVFGGDPNKKELELLGELAAEVNALEAEYEALSDADLKAWLEQAIAFTKSLPAK